MRTTEAVKTLADWDRHGRIVFTLSDLRKMFPHRSDKTLSESLRRLVSNGLLERAANGVYVNPLSARSRADLLEEVALALRRGEYNYLTLECALSEWGVISQVPQSYLTVMTTGRKGTFNTPYGVVEFTHTRRTGPEIIHGTVQGNRPLRLAKASCAWQDLKRVGRNQHLVDFGELQECIAAEGEAD